MVVPFDGDTWIIPKGVCNTNDIDRLRWSTNGLRYVTDLIVDTIIRHMSRFLTSGFICIWRL
jgi:hypothetical protein